MRPVRQRAAKYAFKNRGSPMGSFSLTSKSRKEVKVGGGRKGSMMTVQERICFSGDRRHSAGNEFRWGSVPK